jgi:adenine-specific DNA-methyltransferase
MAKSPAKSKTKPAPVPRGTATKVESLRHKDTRKNIPTEELRDFVRDDEHAPKTMLYPRDPSLDPQLVWKGKDEQDRKDLTVPVVPIYIQEKIHPRAIVDALPRLAQGDDSQPDLFGDFNGLEGDFDRKVDFYHHDQHWSNRLILGDSLLVMTSLAEKEGLKGKVQTIYLDPPYGIKFGSNWQVSTRKRDVKDGKAEDATRQPEQVRAFRDTWKLGIHSYLAYLRDRMMVARELLTETGSIFVQIGDENVHLVRNVMDEVFGSENNIAIIQFLKTASASSELLPGVVDYVLWFAKTRDSVKYRAMWREKDKAHAVASEYNRIQLPSGERRRMRPEEQADWTSLPPGSRAYRQDNIVSQRPPGNFPVQFERKTYKPITGYWKTGEAGMKQLINANRIEPRGSMLSYIRFLDDFPALPVSNVWEDVKFSSRSEDKSYVVQTAMRVIERCLLMTTDPGDLVLDPTCGSGTTAYVAEQWGRRWITCDTSRVALALARTRLMAAKFPYYFLADSPDGIKKEAELTGKVPPPHKTEGDIKKGFVYKRVPHVTLKSIANNPDIKEGMSREQIDAAIAKHAETETLYDQPYEDKKTVRVTGPFTVESLSPHRTISVEEKRERSEVGKDGWKVKVIGPDNFATMIMENLKKAGVQNTVKGERLMFDTLDPYAGEWIHAQGTYTEKANGGGKERRVAGVHRPRAWHGGCATGEGSRKGSGQGHGLRCADRLWFRLRPQRERRGQALRQADGAGSTHEPRSCHGR